MTGKSLQRLQRAGVRDVRRARAAVRPGRRSADVATGAADSGSADIAPSVVKGAVRARVLISVVSCGASVFVLAGPRAGADDSSQSSALNGRFLVTSIGNWAQTNDVYHDEQTVRQVWTIASSCVDPTSCSGKVSSSQGWSADVHFGSSWWQVDRVLDNWQPCSNGTAATGYQRYRFWAVGPDGLLSDTIGAVLGGTDTTYGTSGDCGINRRLEITLPLRLQRLD